MKFSKVACAGFAILVLLAACGKPAGRPAPPPLVVVTPPPPPPPVVVVTCSHTITWVNPTLDVDGNELGPTDLTSGTLYATLIPYEVNEWEWQTDLDAYVLSWAVGEVAVGVWHYELTVTNAVGESDPAFVDKECSDD